ncbi:MAG: ACP S-malonyltransferase [candidate division Zixibacteria bacterium]|nr:ACP S-malonyltransferase [candidate division Zixibacteria bacterium]
MKTALLFPGQASQYVGMGADLHAVFPTIRKMYDAAGEILGYDLSRLSFEGPADKLVQTVHTQPAIFVHSCAMFTLASERGLEFDLAAGHSLGEYSALVAAGVLSFEDALVAVKNRAQFMHEAGLANPGTMAAVLGLGYDAVEQICREASAETRVVVAANYNAAAQIAISGSPAGVEAASKLATAAGAKRVIPLAVGGAFHSPLMRPAPDRLRSILDTLPFRPARRPVILNVTADPTVDPHLIKKTLIDQLTRPVLWYPTLLRMKTGGVVRAIEIGPKKVLLGLAKSVLDGAELISLDTAADLESWSQSIPEVSIAR